MELGTLRKVLSTQAKVDQQAYRGPNLDLFDPS